MHDSDLERMTGVKGSITTFAYADLPPIRVDAEHHHGVGDHNRALASRIPLFEEVLAVVPPHLTVIVEFKQNHEVGRSHPLVAILV
jgi:glycerophosphoryl diester phosphodiesterase